MCFINHKKFLSRFKTLQFIPALKLKRFNITRRNNNFILSYKVHHLPLPHLTFIVSEEGESQKPIPYTGAGQRGEERGNSLDH